MCGACSISERELPDGVTSCKRDGIFYPLMMIHTGEPWVFSVRIRQCPQPTPKITGFADFVLSVPLPGLWSKHIIPATPAPTPALQINSDSDVDFDSDSDLDLFCNEAHGGAWNGSTRDRCHHVSSIETRRAKPLLFRSDQPFGRHVRPKNSEA